MDNDTVLLVVAVCCVVALLPVSWFVKHKANTGDPALNAIVVLVLMCGGAFLLGTIVATKGLIFLPLVPFGLLYLYMSR